MAWETLYPFKHNIVVEVFIISDGHYLSVTQFNKKMENFFRGIDSFKNVYVKGEVSNKYVSGFGHLYFTLKDKNSKVPCIVRNANRKGIGF